MSYGRVRGDGCEAQRWFAGFGCVGFGGSGGGCGMWISSILLSAYIVNIVASHSLLLHFRLIIVASSSTLPSYLSHLHSPLSS